MLVARPKRRGRPVPTAYTWLPGVSAPGAPPTAASTFACASSVAISCDATLWRRSTTATPTVSTQEAIAVKARKASTRRLTVMRPPCSRSLARPDQGVERAAAHDPRRDTEADLHDGQADDQEEYRPREPVEPREIALRGWALLRGAGEERHARLVLFWTS